MNINFKVLPLLVMLLVVLVVPKSFAATLDEEMELEGYEILDGNIVSVDQEALRILVKGSEDGSFEELVLNISEEVILLDKKTEEFKELKDFKKDEQVLVVYKKDTPVAMSNPPMLTPTAVVLGNSEVVNNIKVDKFNQELVSLSNDLQLNIAKDTLIVDRDGEEVSKENIVNKDLLVFYKNSTRSIPAITSPSKIIVLEEKIISDLNNIFINGEYKELNSPIKEDSTYLFPLRELLTELDYNIKWNNVEKSVEVSKDAIWSKVYLGRNQYNFAKMSFELEQGPVLINEKTYLPVSFLEKALGLEVSIENGILIVK